MIEFDLGGKIYGDNALRTRELSSDVSDSDEDEELILEELNHEIIEEEL